MPLSAFPITKRWPAQHPDRLQLYSLPTPNGVKISIMLEEIGLPYEPHTIDFGYCLGRQWWRQRPESTQRRFSSARFRPPRPAVTSVTPHERPV